MLYYVCFCVFYRKLPCQHDLLLKNKVTWANDTKSFWQCRNLCRHCTWSEYEVLIGFSKFTLLLSVEVILTAKSILYGKYVDLKQICTCFLDVLKKLLVTAVLSATRFGQSALSVALIWFAVVRPLGYLLHEISRETHLGPPFILLNMAPKAASKGAKKAASKAKAQRSTDKKRKAPC